MAHFARIINNIVQEVVVVHNNELLENGIESEQKGINFLKKELPNKEGQWIQCSYNTHANTHKLGGTPFRYNYPSPGWPYLPEKDGFAEPKLEDFPSFIFNEDKLIWEPPIPCPGAPLDYYWNEPTTSWIHN
jgi:hypothetical protein